MNLFLCLSDVLLVRYAKKKSCQKEGVQKKDKKGDGHIRGGLSIEGECSNLLQTMKKKVCSL